VVTGGGSGMGRELVRQLAARGAHVATCDVSAAGLAETATLCHDESPTATVTTFVADVSDEQQVLAFRDATASAQGTRHINLLFNNAGIGGGGSFVVDDRSEWDRTFGVCWGGVYFCTRAFLPMLLASEAGHIVNTSSINGFWASMGPSMPHSAYSAAKFAVKGFTEALITDLRINAPHIHASVVMPGHIGTSIAINTSLAHGRDPKELSEAHVAELRLRMSRAGIDLSSASDEDIRQGIQARQESFRDDAPMTAAAAATVILDGVAEGRWRILVGDDAAVLDRLVREAPEEAYGTDFLRRLQAQGAMDFTGS
jgi:NAD(P)-dependent dehydrogenase (short-subunit alcohol dehydrogenase family)